MVDLAQGCRTTQLACLVGFLGTFLGDFFFEDPAGGSIVVTLVFCAFHTAGGAERGADTQRDGGKRKDGCVT